MTPTMHFRYIYGHLHQFWKTAPCEGRWIQIEETEDKSNSKFDAPNEWLKQEWEQL